VFYGIVSSISGRETFRLFRFAALLSGMPEPATIKKAPLMAIIAYGTNNKANFPDFLN